jgi:hypothetical protein
MHTGQAEQIVRVTCDSLDEMRYELIRACVNKEVPNLLLMADDLGLQVEWLRKVQEWLERKEK